MKSTGLSLVLTLALAAPGAFGTAFFYAGPAQNNVDNSSATFINLSVSDFGTISNLSLEFTFSAGCPSDNTISLVHNGITAQVFSGHANADCLGNPSGAYSLASFNGQELNGIWQLQIQDVTGCCSGEGDDITSWNISGNSSAETPEPGSLGLMGVGLASAGIVEMRRRRARPGQPGR